MHSGRDIQPPSQASPGKSLRGSLPQAYRMQDMCMCVCVSMCPCAYVPMWLCVYLPTRLRACVHTCILRHPFSHVLMKCCIMKCCGIWAAQASEVNLWAMGGLRACGGGNGLGLGERGGARAHPCAHRHELQSLLATSCNSNQVLSEVARNSESFNIGCARISKSFDIGVFKTV